MNILITGGLGFIGGRLGQYLDKAGHHVVLGSRKVDRPPEWLATAKVVQLDWSDKQDLMRVCCGIDIVIHLAGMNAYECFNNPTAAFEFNGLATARLAESAVASGVRRIVYLSTAHVYANPLVGIITEDTPTRNPHPYATSNLAGEQATLSATKGSKTLGTVLRLSNVFGVPVTRQIDCWRLVVQDLSKQAIETKKIIIKSNIKQQRDFLPMVEFCKIMKNIIESRKEKFEGIINIGTGKSYNLYDMACMIQERSSIMLEKKIEIEFDEKLTEEETGELEYKTHRQIFEINGITIDSYRAEIDSILNMCVENNSETNI